MTIVPPSGIVTFVFTDIEGSTALLKTLGDDYPAVASAHRAIIREDLRDRDGVEVDTQGDAFFFAFSSATQRGRGDGRGTARAGGASWPAGTAFGSG